MPNYGFGVLVRDGARNESEAISTDKNKNNRVKNKSARIDAVGKGGTNLAQELSVRSRYVTGTLELVGFSRGGGRTALPHLLNL